MQGTLFNEKSRTGRFVFRKLLASLESPLRYRLSNPEQLVKASGIKPGQSVLEIGCGSGFFTASASKMVGPQGFVHAVDLHPLAVEETARKVKELQLTNVNVAKADAQNTGFAEASFDLILLYGVIPAPVISLERLTQETHRLLKPGGLLAVWTISWFWSPQSITKTRSFTYLGKNNGVHQFRRNE